MTPVVRASVIATMCLLILAFCIGAKSANPPNMDSSPSPTPKPQPGPDVIEELIPTPPTQPTEPTGIPVVQDIVVWTTDNYTRIAIYVTANTQFTQALLPPDPIRGGMKRIVVDLFPAAIEPKLASFIPVGDGLVRQVRAAQFDALTVRVVLDMTSLDSYDINTLHDPFRIVIDLDAQVKKAKPTRYEIRKIAVDPGHGGHDFGAIASDGSKEKDLTLMLAREVVQILRKEKNLDAFLTRQDDIFIPLEGRTAIANKAKADLFISIHVNATRSRKTDVKGIETYFYSPKARIEDMELVAAENAIQLNNVQIEREVLKEINDSYRRSESNAMAAQVHKHLLAKVSQKFRKIPDRGVRGAPFYVLMGTRMPAILAEVGFINNSEERRLLKNSKYRQTICAGISDGVEAYIKALSQ